MPVTVNGVELTDADVEKELPNHANCPNPLRRATTALVLRRVLLDEAGRLGLVGADEDQMIDALLASQVQTPTPDEDTCRRHYARHPEHFIVGELVEADHILFQVTPQVDLDSLRHRAQTTLEELLKDPSQFAEMARALSNCPSAALGGNLGQLKRGDTVPEFEKPVFALPGGTFLPHLLQTRHGFHIVRVTRRAEGHLLRFEQVAMQIEQALLAASQDAAWRQYLSVLVGRANIAGIELEGADSPLVQ